VRSLLIGGLLSEFLAPFPNRFISDFDSPVQHHFLDIPIAQGKRVIEPDTVTNNLRRESMTRVHGSAIVNGVEPVRLFYRWVKLTMPFDLLRQILLNFDSRQAQYVHILSFCPVLRGRVCSDWRGLGWFVRSWLGGVGWGRVGFRACVLVIGVARDVHNFANFLHTPCLTIHQLNSMPWFQLLS